MGAAATSEAAQASSETASTSKDGDVAMAEDTAASSTSTAGAEASSSTADAKPAGKKRQGVVLAAEKKVTSKLLDKEGGGPDEKIFVVNE